MPALSAALGDEAIDTFAADALIVIGEQSPLVVQQLVKILDQPESGSVPLAVRILQGIDAAPATTALIRLVCESENSDVTDEAVKILAETGPSAKEAVSLIVDANVDANEWESRTGLAQILRDIGPAVVPELVAALRDPSAHRRLVATWALGDYGPGAKDAVPAPLKATRDRDKKCREAAFIALGRVGGDVDGKLTALLQSLADTRGDGSSAIDKLILIGKPALPVLRQGLHDKNAAVRHGALQGAGSVQSRRARSRCRRSFRCCKTRTMRFDGRASPCCIATPGTPKSPCRHCISWCGTKRSKAFARPRRPLLPRSNRKDQRGRRGFP